MTGKKLTLWATGGAALTALFTWLNTGPTEHEGVQLSADARARLSTPAASAVAPFSIMAAGSSVADGHEDATPLQQNPAPEKTIGPREIAEAKRYLNNYKLASGSVPKFQTLLSVYREIGNNPANAHLIGLTPKELTAMLRSEAQQAATSLSSLVGLKMDGEYPNTPDVFKMLTTLQDAEKYLSLQDDGSTKPGSMWGHVLTPEGTPLNQKMVQDYQREIGIILARNFVGNYEDTSSKNDPRFNSLAVGYLKEIQQYGLKAEQGAGSRDVWKEIGLTKDSIQQQIDRIQNPPLEAGRNPTGP